MNRQPGRRGAGLARRIAQNPFAIIVGLLTAGASVATMMGGYWPWEAGPDRPEIVPTSQAPTLAPADESGGEAPAPQTSAVARSSAAGIAVGVCLDGGGVVPCAGPTTPR